MSELEKIWIDSSTNDSERLSTLFATSTHFHHFHHCRIPQFRKIGEDSEKLLSKLRTYINVLDVAIAEALDDVPTKGLVSICDVCISDQLALLKPLYDAIWLLVGHTESKVRNLERWLPMTSNDWLLARNLTS